ncbi:MAG: hypothetical protein APF78_07125 [Sphingomonadales bacterium BRH_c3]|nr:MAG: hypothetical protein APF78_07125 [Sphingomonadales bacterium BRH_c3]
MLAACKPPPTDADIAVSEPAAPRGPSEPIDSPDTEGAIWADSAVPARIIYGIAGEPSLISLGCIEAQGVPTIRLTRYAQADANAKAFAALIGNGHISRIPIDATEVDGEWLWQAELPASDPDWEVLTGRREVAVTIPGAGRVVLNPSPRPGVLIESCIASAPAETISGDAAPVQ